MSLKEQEIPIPKFDFNNDSSVQVWRKASKTFAKQASGEVRAVVSANTRANSIWNTVELPALMKNKKVTKIITIDPITKY